MTKNLNEKWLIVQSFNLFLLPCKTLHSFVKSRTACSRSSQSRCSTSAVCCVWGWPSYTEESWHWPGLAPHVPGSRPLWTVCPETPGPAGHRQSQRTSSPASAGRFSSTSLSLSLSPCLFCPSSSWPGTHWRTTCWTWRSASLECEIWWLEYVHFFFCVPMIHHRHGCVQNRSDGQLDLTIQVIAEVFIATSKINNAFFNGFIFYYLVNIGRAVQKKKILISFSRNLIFGKTTKENGVRCFKYFAFFLKENS